MATPGARKRGRGGPGGLTWVALGGAALVALGLTFALGMLVGRQWARQTSPAAVADSVRRTAVAPARRSGLGEASAERPAPPPEKLTFYKTLTAPMAVLPLSGRAEVSPKPQPAAKPGTTSAPAVDRAQDPAPARGDGPALPSKAPGVAPAEDGPAVTASEERRGPGPGMTVEPSGSRRGAGEERREESAGWAVQVGVFKSAPQAERVRKELADGGFPAQVTPLSGHDGQVWYRVRVSGLKTRDEALRTAERVRADRSLPTFVTGN